MSKPRPTPSVRGEYIETETGNKISRRASILGPKHIILAGKCVIQHDVVIHGDLVRPSQPSHSSKPSISSTDPSPPASKDNSKDASSSAGTSIHLGRYVFLSPSVVLHPPSHLRSGTLTYLPLRIADNVFIGTSSVIRAASIGSNVFIGEKCSVGNMVIIKDNVRILDGTVLPANSVWASASIIAGRPGRVVGEIGEGWGGGFGGGEGKAGVGTGEDIGVRVRERWALVGNKKG